MPTKTTLIAPKRNGQKASNATNATATQNPWPKLAPVQPVIRVENVQEACAFYQKLGFVQTMAVPANDGTWAWANLQYGASGFRVVPITTPDAPKTKREKKTRKGPRGLGVSFYCNVPNVDAVYNLCKTAGLEFTSEPFEAAWGDRVFSCIDACGYEWMFGQTVRQLTPDQIVASHNPH